MSTDDSVNQASNPLKRPRPVISCLECRRKKLKCDRTRPCQQCIKVRQAEFCSYQPGQEPEPRATPLHDESSPKRLRTAATDDDSPAISKGPSSGPGTLEALLSRVSHLESLLGVTDSPVLSRHQHEGRVCIGGRASSTQVTPSRRTVLQGVFPAAHAFVRSFLTSKTDSRIGKVAQELRDTHDALKFDHRLKRSAMDLLAPEEMRLLLPSFDVCQRLTEIYFDNLEHCFRVLHRQTFDRQLSDFFSNASGSADFLPQLVAVLSIAAMLGVTHECVGLADHSESKLIRSSVKFIQDFLAGLSYKKRHSIEAFQTKSLLLILRWLRLDKQTELWEQSGEILRQALVMGLDRDPSEMTEPCSAFEAEIRRRLWMSTVEIDMMLAMLCNMPCLVPDFTCGPPRNLNDSELLHDDLDRRRSRPLEEWTDGLCQSFLAQSIKQRLHGCKDLGAAPNMEYHHILSHTRSLEQTLKTLPPSLRFNNPTNDASKGAAKLMARMEVDISLRRPLMHLYTAFAYANDETDAFAEARAGFLQSCLMVTSYQDLFDPKYSEIHVERPLGYWIFFWDCYRKEINQSILGLCLEIKRLEKSTDPVLNELQSGWRGPSYTKSSMIHAVKDILEPMTRRIGRIGSDVKELAYLTIVFSSVRSGRANETAILESLEELATTCKLQLEKANIFVKPTTATSVEDWAFNPTPSFDLDSFWTSMPASTDHFFFSNEMSIDLGAG